VYDDQLKLKRECEVRERENSCEDNGERKPSNLTNSKSITKPVKSGDNTQWVKKESVNDNHCIEKLRKQLNFYAREGEIKFVFCTNKPIIFSFARAKKSESKANNAYYR